MCRFLKSFIPLLLCLTLLFVGCTRQKKIDLVEFCKCYNDVTKSDALATSNFLKTEEEEGVCYHVPLSLGENGSAFLTLKAEESGALKELQLTLLQADTENAEAALQDLYAVFKNAVAVLENKTPDTSEATLQSIGLTADSLVFSPFYKTETAGRTSYTVLCRTEGVALFCELL